MESVGYTQLQQFNKMLKYIIFSQFKDQ